MIARITRVLLLLQLVAVLALAMLAAQVWQWNDAAALVFACSVLYLLRLGLPPTIFIWRHAIAPPFLRPSALTGMAGAACSGRSSTPPCELPHGACRFAAFANAPPPRRAGRRSFWYTATAATAATGMA